MIIKSIYIKNVRSYSEIKIDFLSGINFLSGDIGSGKSSILMAIEFALFGFKKGEIEGYQILRKGANNAVVKLLVGNSSDSKNDFEICRNIEKSKNNLIKQINGYIMHNNNLLELAPTEINAYVFKLMNMPLSFVNKDKNLLYRFTVYTPQQQLKEILFTPKENKLELIRKLLDIDKYKLLRDGLEIYKDEIKIEKKIIESNMPDKNELVKNDEILKEELNKLEKNKKHVEEQIILSDKNLIKIKGILDKIGKQNDLINNKLIEYEKENSKIEQLEKREYDINQRLICIDIENKELEQLKLNQNNENLYEKLKEIENKIKKSDDLILENKALIEKNKKINDEINNNSQKLVIEQNTIKHINEQKNRIDIVLTKCKIKDLEVSISKDEKNIKKLEENLNKKTKFSEENAKIKSEIEILNENLISFEKTQKELDFMDVCKLCNQKIDKEHKEKIKTKLIDDTNNAKIRIKSLEELYDKNQDNIEKIEKEIQTGETLKYLLIQNTSKLDDIKNIYKAQLDEINALNEKSLGIKTQIYENNIKELEKEKKQIEDLITKNDEKIKQDAELIKQANEIKIIIEKQKLTDSKHIDLKNEKIRLKEEIEQNKQIIDNKKLIKDKIIEINVFKNKNDILKKDYDEKYAKNYENKLKVVSSNVNIENKIENVKKDILLNKKQSDNLLENTKKICNIEKRESFIDKKLNNLFFDIEKKLFTKYYIEFNENFEKIFKELIEDNEIDVRLDNEFDVLIEQNGYDIDIKNLSGGETSALAIAYRLGLKRIIEENFKNNSFSLLILDEPTDGLSENQISKFGNILRKLNTEQIILVSHDEKIESISDIVIKITKSNHVSETLNQ